MILTRILISTFSLLIYISAFTQNDTPKSEIKGDFSTQGEQEEYWAKTLFQGKREEPNYERYKGKIVVQGNNTIKYDETILHINDVPVKLRSIFEEGIFYPGILVGNHSGETLKQPEPDSTIFFGVNRATVGYFDELKSLSGSPGIKRFKLYLFRENFANPFMYILELQNECATESTDIVTFIKDSRLTYFKFVSILI